MSNNNSPSDFDRIFQPRLEKAVKAVKLLENGAAKRYETTPAQAQNLISELEQALRGVREAYGLVAAAPSNAEGNSAGHEPDESLQGAHEPAQICASDQSEPAQTSDESASAAMVDTATLNTASSDPITIPHWSQVRAFVELIPASQRAAYILHLGDFMYEDAVEFALQSNIPQSDANQTQKGG